MFLAPLVSLFHILPQFVQLSNPWTSMRPWRHGLGFSRRMNFTQSPRSHSEHLQLVRCSSTKNVWYPCLRNRVLIPFPLVGSLNFICLFCSQSPKQTNTSSGFPNIFSNCRSIFCSLFCVFQ